MVADATGVAGRLGGSPQRVLLRWTLSVRAEGDEGGEGGRGRRERKGTGRGKGDGGRGEGEAIADGKEGQGGEGDGKRVRGTGGGKRGRRQGDRRRGEGNGDGGRREEKETGKERSFYTPLQLRHFFGVQKSMSPSVHFSY